LATDSIFGEIPGGLTVTTKLSLPKTILALACLSGFLSNSTFAQSGFKRGIQSGFASGVNARETAAVIGYVPSEFLQQDESSPSDAAIVQEAILQEVEQQNPQEVPVQPSEKETLAPLERRALSPVIQAVNVSIEGLGTDITPEPELIDSWSSVVPLPTGVSRGAIFQCVQWRPSLIVHHPLYFQDVMLERHGHDRWGYLEPFASGAKFFGTIFLSPYLKTLQCPGECQYALGYHRAGSCAPVLKSHIPWDKRAAAVETLSAAGFFWAAPL
jgi:hypothetical protein